MLFSRRLILWAIVLLLFLPSPALNADTAIQPPGSGTESEPYQISEAGHLVWISQDDSRWDKNYIQVSDIDIGEIEWTPIGNTSVSFTGTYTGNDHIIQNLTINNEDTNYQGFFGSLENAVIKGLVFENVFVNGGTYTGAVAGYMQNSFMENMSVTGIVNSSGNNTGGLTGHSTGSILHNISVNTIVSGNSNTGGMIGYFTGGSELRHSYSKGTVTGTTHTGGMIGYFLITSTVASDCYSHASVSGTSYVGGFLGRFSSGSIYRCYSTGEVTGTGPNIAGFAGSAQGTARYCYYDIQTSGQHEDPGDPHIFARTTFEMQQEETFNFFNFYTLWKMDPANGYPGFQDLSLLQPLQDIGLDQLQGSGTEDDPYIISTPGELWAVRQGPEAYYGLSQDIDMHSTVIWDYGRGWKAIGTSNDEFQGNFDGNGFEIINLYINRPNTNYQGLFGVLKDAIVHDIKIADIILTAGNYCGSLTGSSQDSYIEHITISGKLISTSPNTGGLAGRSNNSIINHISIDMDISGTSDTGGIIGYFTGGSELRHSHSKGTVTGSNHTGGVIGYHLITSTLTTDCYSHAKVTGLDYVGGFLGRSSTGRVFRSFSTGEVTGTGSNIHGFAGSTSATFRYCYWDTDTSGHDDDLENSHISGRTTQEMQKEATFLSYNFHTLWQIEEDAGYPSFQDFASLDHPEPAELSQLDGSGTMNDPYLITNANELFAISQDLEANYRLTNDIDMRNSILYDFGRGWIPAGDTSIPYSGTLDGAGHTVLNLYINRPNSDYQGFFGRTENAHVHRINFYGLHLTGGSYSGAVAGFSRDSYLEHILISAKLTATDPYLGGLAGYANNSIINHIGTNIEISGARDTGGIIGYFTGGSELRHSHSKGTVTGTNHTGGVIGYHLITSSVTTDCYSHARITGEDYVGGFLGRSSSGRVFRSFSTGEVTGTGSNIHGFAGSTDATFRYCYWDTDTSGHQDDLENSHISGRTTQEMHKEATFQSYNFYTLWKIEEDTGYPSFKDLVSLDSPAPVELSQLDGSGTIDDPYIITNPDELYAIHQNLAASYRLARDINMERSIMWDHGRGWTPIGGTNTPFSGSFDGAGHTIINLCQNRPNSSDQGLFGISNEGNIHNLILADIHTTSGIYGGALIGRTNNSIINNIIINGKLCGVENNMGGLAGYSSGGSLHGISADMEIYAADNTGGLIGYFTGGSVLSQSFSRGTVIGTNHTGGLIGYMLITSSEVSNCYSHAETIGNSYAGGFIGRISSGNVSDSYSMGEVTGTENFVGGFIGGGTPSALNCYWNMETSGQPESAGGNNVMGRTTLEMTFPHAENTYEEWDFDDIWGIRPDANRGYPYLQWQALNVSLLTDPEDIDVILTGDGNYLQGQPVIISASFGDEYLFLQWTGEHQGLLDDPFNSSAGFIMPSHDVEFTALFETQKFLVTFTVIDENHDPIEGAVINIAKSGTTLITDTDGTAFDEFFPGFYQYSVSKEGHITQTGLSFNVTNQDLVLDPVILPIDTEHAYRVSFIVTDSLTGAPMYKTKILIVNGGQIWKDLTDMDGRAEFYLQNGNYEYTARAGYAYSLVTGGFTVDGHAIEDIAVHMISSVWNAAISIAHSVHEGTFLWAYNEAKSNMINARNSNWKRLIAGSAAKKLMVDDINNDGRLEIIGSFEEHGLWSFEAVSMEWRILYPICPDEWTIANTPQGRQIIASFVPHGIYRIPVYHNGTQFISIPIFKIPADILEAANIDMDEEGIDELLVSFADYGLFIYDFHHNTFIRVVSVAPSNIIPGDITGEGHNDIVCTFPDYGTYIGTFIQSKKGPMDLKDKYPLFDIENNKAGRSSNKQGLQWQRILFITPDQGIGTANIIQDNPGHEIIISHAQKTYYYRFDTSRWYSKPGLAPFDTLISGHFTGNRSHDLIISEPDTDRIYLWINSDDTLMLLYDGLSEGDIRSMATIE